MQANQLRRLAGVAPSFEMAAHRFTRALVQLRKVVRLCEDGFPHGARREAAFRRLLDDKNDFAHARHDTPPAIATRGTPPASANPGLQRYPRACVEGAASSLSATPGSRFSRRRGFADFSDCDRS